MPSPPQPSLSVATSVPSPDEPIYPPPISPLTPTLPPARLPDATPQPLLPSPLARPSLTHSSQPDAVATIAPPPPAPVDFDSNPDVIALRSAISVLQVQKQRAAAHLQALAKARDAALDDPDAFVRQLAAGKVNAPCPHDQGAREEWASLPQPQDVVRCPPINWAQYAVVGSSLDKLHAEQVSHPTQGTPASIGANGTYDFQGGDGKQEKYAGVAAPYAPTKDHIDRKAKGKK